MKGRAWWFVLCKTRVRCPDKYSPRRALVRLLVFLAATALMKILPVDGRCLTDLTGMESSWTVVES